MIARLFRGPDGGWDVAEAGRERTFKTLFQRSCDRRTGRKQPAYNALRAEAA